VQRAVRDSSESRGIEEVLKGGEVSIPLDGLDEPRLRRGSDGLQDHVLARQQEIRRRRRAAALRQARRQSRATRARARPRTHSASC